MKEQGKARVAVVGAGLTGLTAAWYLKSSGFDFHVFEKLNQTGGVIQTHHENGFTFESGPNTGLLSKPEVVELLEELKDECTAEVADNSAKARWIWKNDRWVPLPSGPVSGITTPLFSFADKLRLLGEPFRTKGKDPNESLAQLVLRRMGRSFLNYAIDPFILGIYSGDPANLVTQYAFPKLYRLEQDYGSFIGGAFKKAKEPKSDRDKKATKEIFSVKGGLGNLTGALERKIGREHFTFGCTGLFFEKKGNCYIASCNNEEFSHVISTAGSYELGNLFPFIDKSQLQRIEKLRYSRVVQVSIGFRKWDGVPLKAFGGLVPFIEQRRILGVLFISSFLKDKAPEGGALLSVFLGGTRKPEMSDLPDSEIYKIVEEELTEMLRPASFSPDLFKIFRYMHAIPQYSFESEEKLKAVAEVEQNYRGLVLGGNLRDGIGIADRITQGKNIVSQIINEQE